MNPFIADLQNQLDSLKQNGTFKTPPVLAGPMGPVVDLDDGKQIINLCSNNYLGLANHPEIIRAVHAALDQFGFGTASVRFICGSFTIHRDLELQIASFVNQPQAAAYLSCWNANQALLPALLGDGDAVFSDELNHASIVDACRLCSKNTRRIIFRHNDMNHLADALRQEHNARRKLIMVDGVFSMEGDLADLPDIVALARDHHALVAVDDSHAHGVLGKTGRGTPEHFGVSADIVTGTLGKALGGAAGGFVAAEQPIIDWLIQNSRPQLFSNALPPVVAAGALAALRFLIQNPHRIALLQENVAYFKNNLKNLGFNLIDSPSAIVPIIIGDTAQAIASAQFMRRQGVLITGFGYPVVPHGTARLRAQISADHTRTQLDQALEIFAILRKKI